MLLQLTALGLSWQQARVLPYEELLAVLHCAAHQRLLERLDAESARVASLCLADEGEQQRLLSALAHRASAAAGRFNQRYPAATTVREGDMT